MLTADLEPIVRAAADGDLTAWRDLWLRVEPALFRLARNRQRGRRSAGDDDCRDVVVAVMARLHADRFHRLRGYLARHRAVPQLTFGRWLIVVAKRVAIDCMRAHPEYLDGRRSRRKPSGWVRTEQLSNEVAAVDSRPRVTAALTAKEILGHADAILPHVQRRALELWVAHHELDEIARRLGLAGAAEAKRMVHAALARLRRRLRGDAGAG